MLIKMSLSKHPFLRIIPFFLVLLTIFITFDTHSNVVYAAEKTFLAVDDAFEPTLSQNDNEVTISFKIAKDYYLYQERFSYKAINSTIAKFTIADGIEHDDEYMGLSHIYYNQVDLHFTLQKTDIFPQIELTFQGCTEGMCYPPTTRTFTLDRITEETNPAPTADTTSNTTEAKTNTLPTTANDVAQTTPQQGANDDFYQQTIQGNILLGLLIFFGCGLILSLTPCMYPMYPIWSTVLLGNQEKTVKASLLYSFTYIQGMAGAFMVAGIIIASIGAQFHAFMQQTIVLCCFSVLFIILAFSMLEVFSVTLPNNFVNIMQKISNHQKGGSFVSVFIMGIISAVIASPCTTAPLAAALMYIAHDGNMVKGAMYLYFLGLGMGAPLFIISLVGRSFLPKSGNWMIKVKHLCGFLMLAVPLFLLRNIMPMNVIYTLAGILLVLTLLDLVLVNRLRASNKIPALLGSLFVGIAITTFCFTSETLKPTSHFTAIQNQQELQQNFAQHKLVLLDLRADWCRECLHYEQTTFQDKEVQKALQNFTTLQADVTTNESPAYSIMNTYQIRGVPAILIFKDGVLVKQINGYLDAEDFLNTITPFIKD